MEPTPLLRKGLRPQVGEIVPSDSAVNVVLLSLVFIVVNIRDPAIFWLL